MAIYHYKHPPRFCRVCGAPLVEKRSELPDGGYDVMTGKEKSDNYCLRLSCSSNPEDISHSTFYRDGEDGVLDDYWMGS